MTREEFKKAVFERDKWCVICGNNPVDAHHILERRLFPDGGYVPDNGVALCARCHLQAEATLINPDLLRRKAGITRVVLPPHLPADDSYDKWGNVILPDHSRLPGELFYDESVQKILDPGIKFRTHTKYPKTPHLPWSDGVLKDDFVHLPRFQSYADVVITEKMDGENTTLYHDYIHARSLDMSYHQSRTWVKNLHAKIAHEIPEHWRICGENLYAKHAIAYRDLPSFFMVFAIFSGSTCLSWEDTVDYCGVLGLHTVPVRWGPGMWLADQMPKYLQSNPFEPWYSDEIEGYVIRSDGAFEINRFRDNIAKYVRPNHVTPDTQNWKAKQVIPNQLKVTTNV